MFDRTGIILYTINYKDCVAFYREVIGLAVQFTTDSLTCFAFGESYLMVEIDDTYDAANNIAGNRPTFCLRMNVPNVRTFADKLISQGVSVDYQEQSWGTVAKFHDPDGNLCAFKDSDKFEAQIQEAKN